MADKDPAALADAVEAWKQTRYHFGELIQALADDGVDVDAFRDEFVDDSPVEQGLLRLVEDVHDRHGG